MIYYSNDCLDCSLPCIRQSCSYYKVKHFKCDKCGDEDVVLYRYDGCEICKECLLSEFEVVEDSDWL